MTVITSGSTVAMNTQGSEKTWHVVGAPMRDFDIDLSAILQLSSMQVGEVTVNSYYLPQDESAGKNALKWASGALSVYEKRIGPYPFKELDVVETPTTAGGIEYPGLVVIADELYRQPEQRNYFEFAVAHEVGHQWWYAQVGDDQVNTPWMDESFVQYTTLIYFQDTYGAGVANQILTRTFQDQYDRAKRESEDKPIGLPVAAYTERGYEEIVYGKGPLFFEAVRKQVGDDSFYKFMQTYYQRFKYQVAKPEDILDTINEVSGQNVKPLYDQWVLGK
jgi:aminopeptidase N